MVDIRKLGGTAAALALLAGGMMTVPVAMDDDLSLSTPAAFAKGKGSGGGQGGSFAGGDSLHGKAAAVGTDADTDTADDSMDKLSRKLGKLNAVHASTTAFADADEGATVGMLAAYARETMSGVGAEDAATRLSEISNREVDEDVVAEVDRLLEGKVEADEVENHDVAAVDAAGTTGE